MTIVYLYANPTVLTGSGQPTGFTTGITTETGLPLLAPYLRQAVSASSLRTLDLRLKVSQSGINCCFRLANCISTTPSDNEKKCASCEYLPVILLNILTNDTEKDNPYYFVSLAS